MRSLMSRANNVSSNRTTRTKWVLELNERKDLKQLEQWTDVYNFYFVAHGSIIIITTIQQH